MAVTTKSSKLWLPQHSITRIYKYDDLDGNSVQISKVDILEPSIVTVDTNTFSLAFPSGATVYDTTMDFDMRKLKRESADLELDAMTSISASLALADKTGQGLISHVQQVCKDVTSTPIASSTTPLVLRSLQMPQSNYNSILVILGLAIAVICAITATVCYRFLKRKRTSHPV